MAGTCPWCFDAETSRSTTEGGILETFCNAISRANIAAVTPSANVVWIDGGTRELLVLRSPKDYAKSFVSIGKESEQSLDSRRTRACLFPLFQFVVRCLITSLMFFPLSFFVGLGNEWPRLVTGSAATVLLAVAYGFQIVLYSALGPYLDWDIGYTLWDKKVRLCTENNQNSSERWIIY